MQKPSEFSHFHRPKLQAIIKCPLRLSPIFNGKIFGPSLIQRGTLKYSKNNSNIQNHRNKKNNKNSTSYHLLSPSTYHTPPLTVIAPPTLLAPLHTTTVPFPFLLLLLPFFSSSLFLFLPSPSFFSSLLPLPLFLFLGNSPYNWRRKEKKGGAMATMEERGRRREEAAVVVVES